MTFNFVLQKRLRLIIIVKLRIKSNGVCLLLVVGIDSNLIEVRSHWKQSIQPRDELENLTNCDDEKDHDRDEDHEEIECSSEEDLLGSSELFKCIHNLCLQMTHNSFLMGRLQNQSSLVIIIFS